MQKEDIESLPEVVQAARVLKKLEGHGLEQVVIASGWTRSLLLNLIPNDIDLSYVGPVHYDKAQQYLAEILSEEGIDSALWDTTGIWNAQIANPAITAIEQHLLRDYVCSIDSVYLASDGRLHDTTGFGFTDALSRTLRLNDLETGDPRSPKAKVYIYLEGCRRIAKFGWKPTPETVDAISQGTHEWSNLSKEAVLYLIDRLKKKYQPEERAIAQKVYAEYGWGFVFDLDPTA
jgi:hypothetical protein